ncbi:MAG: NlpC/P60 family protein [Nesterenkonia sp.]|nr:NlpC/P60 family protein [Nesterenkonia sp.]
MTTTTTFASRREMRRQANPVLAHAVTFGRATAGAAAAAGLVAGLGASAYANAPVDDTQRESTSVQMAQGEQAQNEAPAQAEAPAQPEQQAPAQPEAEPEDQGESAAQSPDINPIGEPSGNGGGDAAVVQFAYSGIGTPYVWGGASQAGWDCSGFVNNALQAGGKNPGARTSGGIMANGTPTSNPQPGDVVVEHGVSHVAIYVGNGKAIGAQNPSTGTVMYDVNPGNVDAYVSF